MRIKNTGFVRSKSIELNEQAYKMKTAPELSGEAAFFIRIFFLQLIIQIAQLLHSTLRERSIVDPNFINNSIEVIWIRGILVCPNVQIMGIRHK